MMYTVRFTSHLVHTPNEASHESPLSGMQRHWPALCLALGEKSTGNL